MMGYGVSYGYGMGAWWLIWWVIWAAVLVVPFWRILPRYGIPAWVAIFAAVPIGAVILLWVVAFSEPKAEHPQRHK